MKNLFAFIIIMSISLQIAVAQINTYKKIGSDEVGSIKIVYKRIFKDSIQNYPLFYYEKAEGEYISLVEAIVNGILKSGVTAYRAHINDCSEEFKIILTEEEVMESLGEYRYYQHTAYDNTGNITDSVLIETPYNPAAITSFLVKEAWLYDFYGSLIDKRLVGICPVRKYYREDDIDKTEPRYRKVCWIYYSELQPILSNKKH